MGEIRDSKGTYEISNQHFIIRCNCGSKKGSYIQMGDEEIGTQNSLFEFDYTFKHQTYLFKMMLRAQEVLKSDLVIICKGCKTEFSFNLESYQRLEESIRSLA